MKQMNLFNDSYLFEELQKVRTSMDKRTRAIFSLLAELQTEILNMKEKNEEDGTRFRS